MGVVAAATPPDHPGDSLASTAEPDAGRSGARERAPSHPTSSSSRRCRNLQGATTVVGECPGGRGLRPRPCRLAVRPRESKLSRDLPGEPTATAWPRRGSSRWNSPSTAGVGIASIPDLESTLRSVGLVAMTTRSMAPRLGRSSHFQAHTRRDRAASRRGGAGGTADAMGVVAAAAPLVHPGDSMASAAEPDAGRPAARKRAPSHPTSSSSRRCRNHQGATTVEESPGGRGL